MKVAKVAISLEPSLLQKVDRLVKARAFASRSEAIRMALEEKLQRLHKTDLARECAKLNKRVEQKLADEGLSQDASEWPDY